MSLEAFCRFLQPREGCVVSTAQAWALWCIVSGYQPDREYVAGTHRNYFVRELRALMPNLPSPKFVKMRSQSARGWHGWTLALTPPAA